MFPRPKNFLFVFLYVSLNMLYVFTGCCLIKWEAVRWKPGSPVIIAHCCLSITIVICFHCSFRTLSVFSKVQIFHAVFWIASKHVFYNTWLLHATHVALYNFKTKIYWGKHLTTAIMLNGYDMDLVIHLTRWRKLKRGTRCHCPSFACNSPAQHSIQKCGWHLSSTVR